MFMCLSFICCFYMYVVMLYCFCFFSIRFFACHVLLLAFVCNICTYIHVHICIFVYVLDYDLMYHPV